MESQMNYIKVVEMKSTDLLHQAHTTDTLIVII